MCINVLLVYVCICTLCLLGAYGGHKRVINSPEPELQVVISCPEDWGLNLGLLKEEGVFLTFTSSRFQKSLPTSICCPVILM